MFKSGPIDEAVQSAWVPAFAGTYGYGGGL